MLNRPSFFLVAGALVATGAGPLTAQDNTLRTPTTFVRVDSRGSNRAALGISTGSTGKRDTLGLLIERVTPGSPADRAGLEEGYRIVSINGENLKLDPADAGQPDMTGLTTRRLTRALEKVKPGDDVTLQVYADGATKTMHVKTESLDQLDGGGTLTWTSPDDAADRPVVGLGLDGGGSRRDTLGLLVTSVTTDGPADKAGIEEGNRVARIDSVDLRIPGSEATSGALIGAKVQRFERELEHHKAGDPVTLQVWADGAMKTVTVKTARAGDVYHDQLQRGFRFQFGNGRAMALPITAPMPPMPPMPNVRVYEDGMNDLISSRLSRLRDDLSDVERAQVTDQAIRAAQQASQRAAQQVQETLARVQARQDRAWSIGDRELMGPVADGLMSFGGLRLAPVSDGLSSYFGKGSEKGLLVLDASARWAPLQAGDVILEVNGTPVKDGDRTNMTLDTEHDTRFLVLRKGARQTLVVKAR